MAFSARNAGGALAASFGAKVPPLLLFVATSALQQVGPTQQTDVCGSKRPQSGWTAAALPCRPSEGWMDRGGGPGPTHVRAQKGAGRGGGGGGVRAGLRRREV